MNPCELYDRICRAQVDRDADAFAGTFTSDGRLELPFTRPGVPPLREGREAIRAAAKQGWAATPLRFDQIHDGRVYSSPDPEFLIAEHDLAVTSTTNGRSYRCPFLVMLRAHEGQAAVYREYLNVAAVAEATDRLPALLARLDSWQPGEPRTALAPPATGEPVEVFARYQQAVLANDGDAIAELFALDGVLEFPFVLPGMPASRFEGREPIRAWLTRIGKRLRFEEYRNVHGYATTDPELIVVEHDIAGTVVATGRKHTVSYVYVLRVRAGQITHLRDYVDPMTVLAL